MYNIQYIYIYDIYTYIHTLKPQNLFSIQNLCYWLDGSPTPFPKPLLDVGEEEREMEAGAGQINEESEVGLLYQHPKPYISAKPRGINAGRE